MKIGVPEEIKKTPKLLTRNMLTSMRARSVVVDVAIDQAGCSETSHHALPPTQIPSTRWTTIVHYCVANLLAAVARTATFALTNATLPYILKLADRQYGATDVRRNGAISKVSRQRLEKGA
jgi:alanine dehydrogenase